MNEPLYSAKSCTVYSSVRISSLYCVSLLQLGLENRKTMCQQVSLRKRRAMPLKIYRVHLFLLYFHSSKPLCHCLSLQVFRPKRKVGPRGSGLSHDQFARRRDVIDGLPDPAICRNLLANELSPSICLPFLCRPLAGCVANATGGTAFGQCRMKWY